VGPRTCNNLGGGEPARAEDIPSRKRIGWPGWAITGAAVPTWKEEVSWPMAGLALMKVEAL
jgi:hypothetical protein